MLSTMRLAPRYSDGGVYLGHAPQFTIDLARFDRVVEKITRGLYFAEFNERVPAERESEVFVNPSDDLFGDPALRQVFESGQGRVVGDVFQYRIARAAEPPGVALCVMLLFGSIAMVCSLLRPGA